MSSENEFMEILGMTDPVIDAGNEIGAADKDELGDDTRARLILVARRLFAKSGYEGTSIRAITRSADANLGAVTYHFGSKEQLYAEVLSALLTPLADRVEAVLQDTSRAPADRLEGAVSEFFAHLAENPDQPSLIMQEISSSESPCSVVADNIGRVLRGMMAAMLEAQHSGSVRHGNPLLMCFSLLSQPIYLTLVRQAMTRFGIPEGMGMPSQEQVTDHALKFIRDGLTGGLSV